jgi:hypothetical protein
VRRDKKLADSSSVIGGEVVPMFILEKGGKIEVGNKRSFFSKFSRSFYIGREKADKRMMVTLMGGAPFAKFLRWSFDGFVCCFYDVASGSGD